MANMSNLLLYIGYYRTITIFSVMSYMMSKTTSKRIKKAVQMVLICSIASILLHCVYTFVYRFSIELFAAILFADGLRTDVGVAKIIVWLPIIKGIWIIIKTIAEANSTFRLTAVIADMNSKNECYDTYSQAIKKFYEITSIYSSLSIVPS